jgi:ribosomal-protein-serine acetyltransferase
VLRFVLSDHCHLRLFEEADAEQFHRLIDANRAHLTPWMPWAADETPEATLRFIRLTRRQVADNDGFQTAIVCDGRIVGAVGFHGVDWDHRSTSIGYWLDAGHQGRGIMTGAVRALIDHALTATSTRSCTRSSHRRGHPRRADQPDSTGSRRRDELWLQPWLAGPRCG